VRRHLILTLLAAAFCHAATEIGTLNNAAFRIDVPDNHNGQLIVYCHGYASRAGTFKEGPLRADLADYVAGGYALIQSGYSTGGWAVEQALKETEELRRYFAGKHGRPKRTIVTGHSMGGLLTVALVEKHPEHYDAGLALCGALEPSHAFTKRREFDAIVLFDYYFPGIIGSAARPAPEGGIGPAAAAKLTEAVHADPAKAEALRQWLGLKKASEIPGLVGFMTAIQMELVQRAGGNPFDNRDTVYSGGPDEAGVNRGVKRYGADAKAAAYLREFFTTTGKLERPVLALHTTYDPVVPAWAANGYRDLVQITGSEAHFVQRWVVRDGHCTMTPAEIIGAFNDLVKWLDAGTRPSHGEQLPAQP
jgi:pimeloyl-ACP methyl ester carboxylesterase